MIHIGQTIKCVACKKMMETRIVADKMCMTKQNVNQTYRNEQISTSKLWKFCEVMDTNFFRILADEYDKEHNK